MTDLFPDFDISQWSRPFSEDWWQATCCSTLVGIVCGVLGCYVVLRRMALIGDALSHAVLPGVVLAYIFTGSTGIVGLLAGALLAGLVTAILINLVVKFSRTKDDSSIGIVFTALFAVGVILISALPKGTHFDMKCFLFGDPLAVRFEDVLLMSFVCPTVLLIIGLLYHPLKLTSFDPIVAAAMGIPVVALHYLLMGTLSATVVAGLKATGVVLVVALIITPASAAYLLTNRLSVMIVLAGALGGFSALGGLPIAWVLNVPSGPTMVVFATFIFILALFFSPSQGVIVKAIRRARIRRHVECEDVMKAVYRNVDDDDEWCAIQRVAEATRMKTNHVAKIARQLAREGFLRRAQASLQLTEMGLQRALEMVRSHRLWESYLTERANVPPTEVHEQAEILEHVHELADEVDETLGHPQLDPHGEVIPRGEVQP